MAITEVTKTQQAWVTFECFIFLMRSIKKLTDQGCSVFHLISNYQLQQVNINWVEERAHGCTSRALYFRLARFRKFRFTRKLNINFRLVMQTAMAAVTASLTPKILIRKASIRIWL